MAESFCTMQEPLTPEDCDLRGYDFMPLYGNRYFKSSSYMHAASENPRAGMAAMKLWWEAWYQVPCGSLPDDDIELAMLADFGTDKRGWAKAKEIALRGFVKCSDGRLYHKELCEIALDKFDLRLKSDEKREADRERLKAWRAKQKERGNQPNIETQNETRSETVSETHDETTNETHVETNDETRFVAGKRVESRDISSLRSDTPCGPPSASKPDSRGSRIADGWKPTDAMRAFALGLHLNPTDVGEQFRDYWISVPGAKGRKSDWEATWRNWCRKEAERAPRKMIVHSQQPSRQERVREAFSGAPRLEDLGL